MNNNPRVGIETAWLSLANLQKEMQNTLLASGLPSQYQEFISNEIESSSKMSAKAHLAIYQRSYTARLHQCMANQFPVLQYALGDELFQLFVRQYLHSFPSEHYSLTNLGDNFSLFLQQTRLDADQEIKDDWPDFMIELTDFETQLIHLYEQNDQDIESASQQTSSLSLVKDEQLELAAVIKLFNHSFPIMAYYKAVSDDKAPQLPMAQQSHGVVIRRNYRLSVVELNHLQYLFLSLFIQEGSVEQSKEQVIAEYCYTEEVFEKLWLHWREYFITTGILTLNTVAAK